MHAKIRIATWLAAAAALGGMAATAPAQGGATFTVRNDTNVRLNCAIRKAGRGVAEDVRLKPGETWTHTYPKPKPRYFRCEGAAPIWYLLHPGLAYRMATTREGMIVLAPAGR